MSKRGMRRAPPPHPGPIQLRTLGIALTEIGEVTRTRKMLIVDVRGKRKPLKATGYNHFERSRGE